MKTVKISTMVGMQQYLDEFNNDFIFRGMANSFWRLRSSIDRDLEQIRKENHNILLSDTKQNFFLEMGYQTHTVSLHNKRLQEIISGVSGGHDQLKIGRENFVRILIFMQHYRFPTRLLDFTSEWIKALFFCLEDVSECGDFAVFAINKTKLPSLDASLTDANFLYQNDLFSGHGNIVTNFYSLLRVGAYLIDDLFFERIKVQSGLLVASGRSDYDDYQDQLGVALKDDEDYQKIVVSKEIRNDVREFLLEKKITHDSMYPNDIEILDFSEIKEKVICLFNQLYPVYRDEFDIF